MPAESAPQPPQADLLAGTPHALTAGEVAAHLQTSLDHGLTPAEAARRLTAHGANELAPPRRVSAWGVFLGQFQNVLIVILLLATAISAVLGHTTEAIAITVIVLFAVLLGFVQEFRAERALEALHRLAAPTATVVRGGQEVEVAASDLVPGDVVKLASGDRVPADLRLAEAVNLQAEEAALTGESLPVEKGVEPLPEGTGLADCRNMAYAATVITYGRGRGVVVDTGARTQVGRIAGLIETIEARRTPLQEGLDRVGHQLAKAALLVVALIVALGVLRGQPLVEMFIFGVALAVAVVPEALPAVVTISLALGVRRMVKRHALVRRLPAVETLGSTSVICSDKTGTLTRDEMTVRRVMVAGLDLAVGGSGYEPRGDFRSRADGAVVAPAGALRELLEAGALACDAQVVRSAEGRWSVRGDPTEGALVVAAAKAGVDARALGLERPRVDELPFTSERKRMTVLNRTGDGVVAHTKGAPEVVLGGCSRWRTADGESALDAAAREQVLAAAQQMAGEALRVLAVARKSHAQRADAESGMTFLGLVGMSDPPREEARTTIATCRQAGIKVVMITGDHPVTARAIARELGLLQGGRVVTGADLDAMGDEDLGPAVETIEVYARVSPAHKLRVVSALQSRGYRVAMTGDGVNDAPALKRADIGVAMGLSGTDVSREAAAMTLTDDNFASIVAAVEEGRGIVDNIKKYLMYLLSSNIGEVGLMAGATLLGLPLPLTAVQVLYVNLATDGLPALALAVDPPARDLMHRRPRDPGAGLFTRPVVALMLIGGVWSTLVNVGLFVWALGSERTAGQAMTMTFVSLVLIQFFKAYSFRSDRNSILVRPLANRWLNLAVLWELGLLSLVVYLPVLQEPFATFSLTALDWLVVGLLAFSVVPVLEIGKWAVRRGWLGRVA
ncbi:MAG: cation-translocating P-type ATPase [Gammaproteobacteria bacterium]|nr:cation-translocating P-type ATPase [Gammaproteobacteria bacterium]